MGCFEISRKLELIVEEIAQIDASERTHADIERAVNEFVERVENADEDAVPELVDCLCDLFEIS
ncbi:unnamed protein product [marine sediment metagenome]|uniref:Uncharacterized protein n=1 Tax=marine sediment metagenome TaxID=412755 RepID=X1CRQ1_9ZZZZ